MRKFTAPTSTSILYDYMRGGIPPSLFAKAQIPLHPAKDSHLAEAMQRLLNLQIPISAENIWSQTKDLDILFRYLAICDEILTETSETAQKSNKTFPEPQITDEAIEAKRKALIGVLEGVSGKPYSVLIETAKKTKYDRK